MSEMIEKTEPDSPAKVDLATWKKLVAESARKPRRTISIRLASANRTLASLRHSERCERQMLQTARERLSLADQMGLRDAGLARAQIELEVSTHESNVQVIERQIAMVRMAIEHLRRRSAGWSARRPSADKAKRDGKADGSDAFNLGFAAVRAIRAHRLSKTAAGANA